MASVTVHGASGGLVVVTYDTAAYATLASTLLSIEPTYTSAGALIYDASGSTTIPDGSLAVVGIGLDPNVPGVGVGDFSLTDNNTDSGQLIVSGNGTNLTFDATAGAGTVVAGDGVGSYNFESGNWQLNNTPDSVSGTTVTAGSGFDVFAAGAGDSTVVGGTGTLFSFGNSLGTVDYQLGSGGSYIVGAPGGTSDITGGSGAVTVAGSDGTVVNFSGAADTNYFIAGSGNETLNAAGATGSNLLYAGSGNDSLSAGSGNDTLFAGSGDSTMTGGSGNDVFAFVDQTDGSTSMDTVNDFSSNDFLMLINGVSITNEDTSTGNLVVTLSDMTQVTFTGVTSDLSSNQIIG